MANAFNVAQGNAIMSGSIEEIFEDNMNLVALFRGTMEDFTEMGAGLEELAGRKPLDVILVLGVFFFTVPEALLTILKAEQIDSAAFNQTLRAELSSRGISLAERVQFAVGNPTPAPNP